MLFDKVLTPPVEEGEPERDLLFEPPVIQEVEMGKILLISVASLVGKRIKRSSWTWYDWLGRVNLLTSDDANVRKMEVKRIIDDFAVYDAISSQSPLRVSWRQWCRHGLRTPAMRQLRMILEECGEPDVPNLQSWLRKRRNSVIPTTAPIENGIGSIRARLKKQANAQTNMPRCVFAVMCSSVLYQRFQFKEVKMHRSIAIQRGTAADIPNDYWTNKGIALVRKAQFKKICDGGQNPRWWNGFVQSAAQRAADLCLGQEAIEGPHAKAVFDGVGNTWLSCLVQAPGTLFKEVGCDAVWMVCDVVNGKALVCWPMESREPFFVPPDDDEAVWQKPCWHPAVVQDNFEVRFVHITVVDNWEVVPSRLMTPMEMTIRGLMPGSTYLASLPIRDPENMFTFAARSCFQNLSKTV